MIVRHLIVAAVSIVGIVVSGNVLGASAIDDGPVDPAPATTPWSEIETCMYSCHDGIGPSVGV